MISGLDHLVILVDDLERATRDYERLGFRVTPGGEHADGLTRNALIPFWDGSYLEIVAFLDPSDSHDNMWGWRRFVATGGLIDHCLISDDLESDVERMRVDGLTVKGPDDGGRRLPDGEEIRWRSASLEQEGRALPFLIQDLTPRSSRVPVGEAADHPNGATGVSVLVIQAPYPLEAARSYAQLVGNEAAVEGDEPIVSLGRCGVSFAGAPDDAGPTAVHLVAESGSARELDVNLTHGARIILG